MVIRIDIEPFQVTQDVAVSVAFLITDIVEFAMFGDAKVVAISLVAAGAGAGSARRTIEYDARRGATTGDPRSAERSVGKECVRTCRSRLSPKRNKKKLIRI